MAKKQSMIIILSISLLFLFILQTGCGTGFYSGKTQIQTYNFRSGTDGISMQFLEGMPPKKVYVGTDFTTGLKIKNMGAYDLTNGAELKITVPDESAFQFKTGSSKQITLKGKSLYTKDGEEDIPMFQMKALCFPGYEGTKGSVLKNYTRKIKASLCYGYETAANADLCIDTMKFVRQSNEKPACAMNDVTLSGGQGGPVGVVRISPSLIPISDKEFTIQLAISISKLKGTDYEIYRLGELCSNADAQNFVGIEAEIGGQPLDCKPNEIKARERDPVTIICTKNIPATLGAYTTPVAVKMKYQVHQTLFQDITVEPPPSEQIDCNAIKGTSTP